MNIDLTKRSSAAINEPMRRIAGHNHNIAGGYVAFFITNCHATPAFLHDDRLDIGVSMQHRAAAG